jgi:hypothetical protein
MDEQVRRRLDLWHNQISLVEKAELAMRVLESQEEPLWHQIYLQSDGKNQLEREAKTWVHDDWRAFQEGLVAAKTAFNKERSTLELRQAAFQASYLSYKIDGEAIQKFPKGFGP